MHSTTDESVDCTVTTLTGLEPVLLDELKSLGIKDAIPGSRAIMFRGTWTDVYRCLHMARTALRVFVRIRRFEARSPDDLYREGSRTDWARYLSPRESFAVNCTSSSNVFRHSGFAALRLKDAIADTFRKRTGKRPSVDTENPDVRFNLHITGTTCTVSRDAAGISLHRRGYRTRAGEAPLSECLAAGLVMLAGWRKDALLVDPFCGSGTIVIEAAMMSRGIPPGALRKQFGISYGCETWRDFDRATFDRVVKECDEKVLPAPRDEPPAFIGIDSDDRIIDVARENARRAGVADQIAFETGDFRNLKVSDVAAGAIESARAGGRPRLVVTNPPYGERLGSDEGIGTLYQESGDTLKQQFPGTDAWILSGNLPALKRVGLRSERRIELMNGPIECRFVHYKLHDRD